MRARSRAGAALMGTAWACAALTAAPHAFAQAVPATAPVPDARASGEPADDADEASPTPSTSVSPVTVTAHRRPQYGAVVGDIKPELQLGPSDIRSYGVSSVNELLDELAPQLGSIQGRGGESPVVLINGRRISGLGEVRNIPTEAIQRIDILPEEVALKYGYGDDQKVINIVLRRRFRAWTGEVQGGGPTEGGQATGQAEADLFHVNHDTRLNLDLKYQGQSNLTDADRDLTSVATGQPFSILGNVVSPTSGGEIDPALSALAGRTVTVAGVPAGLTGRAPTLADFAATAGVATESDVGADRTLLPATQSITANAVLSQPLPLGIDATVNATLGATTSEALQGLSGVALLVPAGNPFSPFGQAVDVDRYVPGLGPLRQSIDGFTAHLGSTLNRDVGDWRLSLTDAYDHADSWTATDAGVNPSPLQAALAAGSPAFNPFAALPASLVQALPQDEARSHSDALNIQMLGNGPLLNVPAGQLTGSFKAGDTGSLQTSSTSFAGAPAQNVSLSRNDLNAQVSLDLPLTSRDHHVAAFLGDLSVNANAAVDELSDYGVLKTFGYGLNWKPFAGWTVIASQTQDQEAPTIAQLGAPLVATPGVQLFDYIAGQTVSLTQVTGGEPGLKADYRHATKLEVNWQPLSTQQLYLNASYVDSHISNPIETFPAADAVIEAAFPDRFVRDAQGALVEEDHRPVNFASADRKELRWGLNFSHPIGPQPSPDQLRKLREAWRAQHPGHGGGGEGGDGGDRPRGPGGGGGRGGGFGRGGGRGILQFAVYHTVYFEDRQIVRPYVPALDFLNGAATGETGGQPRHEIQVQAGVTLFGFGARLSADWKSGTRVFGQSMSASDDLSFSSLGTINFRLFNDFTSQTWATRRAPWLRGTRVVLNLVNLFDQRIDVRNGLGQTPIIYEPAYIDPQGRTVTLSLRKLFF